MSYLKNDIFLIEYRYQGAVPFNKKKEKCTDINKKRRISSNSDETRFVFYSAYQNRGCIIYTLLPYDYSVQFCVIF